MQSHCDIFRETGVKIFDRTYNKWFSQKSPNGKLSIETSSEPSFKQKQQQQLQLSAFSAYFQKSVDYAKIKLCQFEDPSTDTKLSVITLV